MGFKLKHIGNPTHSALDSAPPAHDLSSSSIDIHVLRFSNTRKKTPTVRSSQGPRIRHTIIAPPHKSLKQPVPGNKRQRTTIDMLPEDALVEIFDFYRLSALKLSRQVPPQWKWLRLAHVCRKWRHVISISPRRLDLRILCTSRGPIEIIMGSWPTLPLLVRHTAPKSRPLPRNIVAAFRRPDRIYAIDLVLSSWLIGSIVEMMQEPFPAPEFIRITSKGATGPPMLVREAFLGGYAPHLREIKLDSIAFPFPAIRQVLSSTSNLVELHLPTNIPNDVYFSPDDLVTGLSTLVQLERLTFGFHSPASSPPPSMIRRPPQRTTLPSLTFLGFHGASEYLDEFAARIDLPALYEVKIRLFNDIIFEIPRVSQVIPRLNTPDCLLVIHSRGSVSVNVQQGVILGESRYIHFRTSCRRLDGQLSFVTQILNQLSPLLPSVRNLVIGGFPFGEGDADTAQWLDLFRPLAHVTQVSVWEPSFAPGIAQALDTEEVAAGILPELALLHLIGYRHSPSAARAAERFIATRGLSGRTISLSG